MPCKCHKDSLNCPGQLNPIFALGLNIKDKSMAINFGRDSELLKALGHPVRLKIVAGLLESNGCNVNKMVAELRIPQSTVSQHLATLRHAKVLIYQKAGTKICYRVADKRIAGLVKALRG